MGKIGRKKLNPNAEKDLRSTDPFDEWLRYFMKKDYQEKFNGYVQHLLLEMYGEEDANKIIELINEKTLRIYNPNDFLPSKCPAADVDNFFFYAYSRNLEEYILNTVYSLKRLDAMDALETTFTSFFMNVASIVDEYDEKEIPVQYLFELLKQVALACITFRTSAKIAFRFLDDTLAEKFSEKYKFNPATYKSVCKLFLHALFVITLSRYGDRVFVPSIEIIHGFYLKNRKKTSAVIAEKFDMPFEEIEKVFDNTGSSPFNCEFESQLETFCRANNEPDYFKSILNKFENMYLVEGSLQVDTKSPNIRNTKANVSMKYLELGTYLETPLMPTAIVTVVITKNNLEQADHLITYAAMLLCIKTNSRRSKGFGKGKGLVIRIRNKFCPTVALIEHYKKKLKELREIYNENIYFEIEVSTPSIRGKSAFCVSDFKEMHIISDIHADYNKGQLQDIQTHDKFIINCGDTSGNVKDTIDYIQKNISFGVLTHGNHLGYSGEETIEDSIELLKETFPLSGDVSYLNNMYKEVNGVIFIGCCLYTDFGLYGDEKKDLYKQFARNGMNDFRCVKTRDKGKVRLVTPDDYEKWHRGSLRYLSETTLKFTDKPVVVLTHFAPHILSINEKYKGSPLNPAFVSDLSNLLNNRPNIKLWCHGHVHDACDYMVNKTRVICNPYGYYHERNTEYLLAPFPFKEG